MKTCLIVEDNVFDSRVIEQCVAKRGLTVSQVSSGADAIDFCKKGFPDCVLLDWEMPEINGIEVLKTLRTLKGGDKAVIIICTSHQHQSFVGYAHENGASSYITKPVTEGKLEKELMKHGLV